MYQYKSFKCKWLPDINPCKNLANYGEYEKDLYNVFRQMFFIDKVTFEGLPVKVKISPRYLEYETSFIHLTCKTESKDPKDLNDREPDLRRAERLHWIKLIIEKYPCLEKCINCEGLLLYKEYYNGNESRERTKIFFPKEQYIIVLEKRKDYYELITAFYIERGFEDKNINKYYNKFNEYKRQGTPLI